MLKAFDATWVPPEPKKKKSNKPSGWFYVAEDEPIPGASNAIDFHAVARRAAEEAMTGSDAGVPKTRPKKQIDYGDKEGKGKRRSNNSGASDDSNIIRHVERPRNLEPRGFDRNLEPEKILASTVHNGCLLYFIKWKDCPTPDLVLDSECNKHCPLLVLEYLTNAITFETEKVAAKV
jgi:hypothetical protein